MVECLLSLIRLQDGLLKKVKVGHSLRDSFLKLLLINLAQTLFYHFHVLGR